MRQATTKAVRRVLVVLMLATGLAMAAAQPAGAWATVELESATLQARGAAIEVTYTVTCDAGNYVSFNTSVNQRSGNDLAAGYGYGYVDCTGEPQSVPMTIVAGGAPFRPGAALFTTSIYNCNPWGSCEYTTVTETFRITQN
jgi:hypothetical protein